MNSCFLINCFRALLNFFSRKRNSTNTVRICEKISCNCALNSRKLSRAYSPPIMAQAQLDLQSLLEQQQEDEILPVDSGPAQKKPKKIRKRRIPKAVCTTLPLIVEVRKNFSKPYPPPQVILEQGWTLYFGNENGDIHGSGFLNIRNQETRVGVAIAEELFDCFVQGLLELRKK